MKKTIKSFLESIMFEKHSSLNTIAAYRNDLTQLCKWMDKHNFLINDLTHNSLTEFLVEKKNNGYEFSSIARSLFCFREFFTWAFSNSIIKNNPSELLESPKLWSTLPEILSPDEINLLINSIKGKKHLVLRTKTILEILYGCGLRISELVNLKLQDINLTKEYMICYGKGSKERLVPFSNKVKKNLVKWIEEGRLFYLQQKKSEFLFVSQKKTPLSRQHVWLELKKLAKTCAIEKNIYPHIFRHSYATHLLAGGGDLRVVQELLGHSDITTTQRYTQVDQSHILKKYSKFHPRA